jgi:hypothetical protein
MISACALFRLLRGRKALFSVAFALGFLSAWCYSNPHFLLLPAFVFSVAEWLSNSERRDRDPLVLPPDAGVSNSDDAGPASTFSRLAPLRLPLFLSAGIALGYTLHPQFPNTFLNWKIQCVDVVWQALTGRGTVALGTEFNRPTFAWLVKNALIYLIFVCDAVVFAKLAAKRGSETRWSALRRVDPTAIAMFAAAAVAIFATPFGMRAMEYAAPFVLLSLGVNLTALKREGAEPPYLFAGKKFALSLKILVVVLAFAFVVFQTENYSRKKGMRPLNDFAVWLDESGVPPGAIIANLAWSDYPFLLYSCPRYRYISGMDPMFSYAVAPKKVAVLEKFRRGKLKLTSEELERILGTEWIFLRKIYKVYACRIKNSGCLLLYNGPDGWLFHIPKKPSPPATLN